MNKQRACSVTSALAITVDLANGRYLAATSSSGSAAGGGDRRQHLCRRRDMPDQPDNLGALLARRYIHLPAARPRFTRIGPPARTAVAFVSDRSSATYGKGGASTQRWRYRRCHRRSIGDVSVDGLQQQQTFWRRSCRQRVPCCCRRYPTRPRRAHLKPGRCALGGAGDMATQAVRSAPISATNLATALPAAAGCRRRPR